MGLKENLDEMYTRFGGRVLNIANRIIWGPILHHKLYSYFKEAKTVLELGSGHGYEAFRMVRVNPNIKYLGIDYVQEFVDESNREAMKRGLTNVKFIVGDLNEFKAKDTYDIIFSQATIELISNFDNLIDEIDKSLNPDGLFIGYIGGGGLRKS